MNLQTVNFTDGIKSSVLNANFEALKKAIQQERLLTAGSGIANGLNLVIQEDFKIRILPGTLIDTNGDEVVFTTTMDFEVEKPFLKTISEKLLVNPEGAIYLSHVPYDIARHRALVPETMQQLKIIQNTTQLSVEPRNIKNKMLIVDTAFANTYLTVTYNYADVRYDTIYINQNDKIVIAKGTSATSSSIYLPDNVESKALLYILKVDPLATYSECYYAGLSQLTSIKSLRNVYTDADGNFYIGGIKLNELQLINLEKPVNPQDGQFWYDVVNNILFNYNTQNGIADWVAINNQSAVANYESYLWTPENNPEDEQVFIFDYDQLNLHYIPNKNALTIIVDQYVLHSDQYTEITYQDAINDSVLNALLLQKGYPAKELSLDERYENTGIGFRLKHPLNNPSYVEARVFHTIQLDQTFERFQRSATFMTENYLTLNTQSVVYLPDSFRYHENQLTLFVDGRKLIPEIDYLEGDGTQTDGEIINFITFLKSQYSMFKGILNYRIVTNVYSYDHVEGVIAPHLESIKEYTQMIDEKMEKVDTALANYQTLATRISNLQTNVSSHTISIEANTKTLSTQAVTLSEYIELSNQIRQAYTSIQNQLTTLQESMATLTTRVDNLEQTEANLSYQFANYQIATSQTLTQMQQAISKLQEKTSTL